MFLYYILNVNQRFFLFLYVLCPFRTQANSLAFCLLQLPGVLILKKSSFNFPMCYVPTGHRHPSQLPLFCISQENLILNEFSFIFPMCYVPFQLPAVLDSQEVLSHCGTCSSILLFKLFQYVTCYFPLLLLPSFIIMHP